MASRQIGDTIRLSTTFKVGVTLTDPDTITLTVTTPAGTPTSYTYGAAQITKDSTGAYHKDVVVTAAGIWWWKWTGTGAAAGVDEGSETVDASLPSAILCTVGDVKLQMESDATTTDDVIQRLILEASEAIQNYTGRRIRPIDAAAADRYFDADDAWDSRRRELLIWDLSTTPTEVQILDSAGTGVATLTVATDLLLVPRNRQTWQPVERLRLRPSAISPASGQEVRVKGVWGWPAIPEFVSGACVLAVRARLRQGPSAWMAAADEDMRVVGATPPGGWMLPMAAKQMLEPIRRIGLA
jgi:hypothetical protein